MAARWFAHARGLMFLTKRFPTRVPITHSAIRYRVMVLSSLIITLSLLRVMVLSSLEPHVAQPLHNFTQLVVIFLLLGFTNFFEVIDRGLRISGSFESTI